MPAPPLPLGLNLPMFVHDIILPDDLVCCVERALFCVVLSQYYYVICVCETQLRILLNGPTQLFELFRSVVALPTN